MTNSQLFKQAHAMTKQVIQTGDNYQATFGLCLKVIKAEAKQAVVNNVNFLVVAVIVMTLVNNFPKVVSEVKWFIEIIIFFGLIFFNPFSLIIYNGVYKAIIGG